MKKLLCILFLLLCMSLPVMADTLPDFAALVGEGFAPQDHIVYDNYVHTTYTATEDALTSAVNAYLVRLSAFGLKQQLSLPIQQSDCTLTLYSFISDQDIPTMTCSDASLGWIISETHLLLDLRVYPDGTATVEILCRPELLIDTPILETIAETSAEETVTSALCQDCEGQGIITQSCGACSAQGIVTRSCSTCDGHGERRCGTCSGSGYSRCSTCGGDGQRSCSSCGGRGHHSNSHHNGHHSKKTCSSCGGDGRRGCSSCNNTGRRNCSVCAGMGQSNCGTCSDRGRMTDRCNTCEGTGHFRTPCGTCQGAGRCGK